MKTHAHFGFIALLAIGIASCGKSNTSKITNHWKVVSSDQEQTMVNDDGEKSFIKTTFTETSISTHSEYTPPNGSTDINESTGKVTENALNIKKDGTWTWNQQWSYENGQVYTNLKYVQNGTWSFAAKTKGDDFKKNERIVFNILSKTSSYDQIQGQATVSSNTATNTYLSGENMLIYTIVSSKNKELQLELENSRQYTINGDTSSDKMTQKMTLKEQ